MLIARVLVMDLLKEATEELLKQVRSFRTTAVLKAELPHGVLPFLPPCHDRIHGVVDENAIQVLARFSREIVLLGVRE